jgi:purine-binding chemotaxis protein CheW
MPVAAETNNTSAPLAAAGKYLTFRLKNESYGIVVLKIREIIRLQTITPVPQMPSYIKGVLNLRGKIIPVIDLRIKFGLADIADADHNCIIVVKIDLPNRTSTQIGLIVDAVEEVINISLNEIEPAPDFGTALDTTFILGLAKIKGSVKTLLDIDRVLTEETLSSLGAATL